MAATEPQARKWVFTVWPGHILNGKDLHEWFSWFQAQQHSGVRYIVAQLELATDTRGIHVQGYIHYSGQKRPSTIGRIYGLKPESFQMGTVNATPADNRAYCTDSEKRLPGTVPWEFGECPGGQGSKLTQVAKLIETKGLRATIKEHPATFIVHSTGMGKLANYYEIEALRGKRRTEPVRLIVVYGDAGCGKTTWADAYDPEQSFTFPEQSDSGPTWFDGYQGERTLVIQDWDDKTMKIRTLLRMCDETYHQFKVHGGYTIGKWDTIIITANPHPADWYNHRDNYFSYDGVTVGPLQRRIKNLFHGTGMYPNNRWTENQEDILEMPTRSTIDAKQPVDFDKEVTEILDDLKAQQEAEDNDFMGDIPPTNRVEDAESDRIMFGEDGDVEPEGENLFGGKFDVF